MPSKLTNVYRLQTLAARYTVFLGLKQFADLFFIKGILYSAGEFLYLQPQTSAFEGK